MGGDYTRFTFRPKKLYSAVLKQQGRVSVDADFNEHAEIDDRHWRAETLDIIGRCIVPRFTPDAFRIFRSAADLTIGRGRMYVDGILVENFGVGDELFELPLAELRPKDSLPYVEQPFPFKDPKPAPVDRTPGAHLVFIDVWQRELTALEDPLGGTGDPKSLKDAPIREVALGGPDTATRLQTAWQVRLLPAPGITSCADPVPGWGDLVAPSSGRLTVTAPPGTPSTDECLIEPGGGYRGLENRLYRVEVHTGGNVGGGATFKWSRDNGSVVSAVTDIPTAGARSQIVVSRFGRDQVLRFRKNDWVEVLDDYTEFQDPRTAGHLAQVTDIDEANRILTISPALPASFNPAAQPSRHTRVRRWDQQTGGPGVDSTTGLIPVTSAAVELEAGIKVSFGAALGTQGTLRPGDYWVFAARTTTGTIEELDQAPPRGIHHHFCRLAVIIWGSASAGGSPSGPIPGREEALRRREDRESYTRPIATDRYGDTHLHDHEHDHGEATHSHAADANCPVDPHDGTRIIDCRRFWPPRAGCCTEVVEPGESIQEAIDRLPASGGCVCLKTGVHEIDHQLTIAQSNVVLHGEAPGVTIRHRSGEAMLRIAGPPEATIDNVMVHDLRFEATEAPERPALIQLHRVADAVIQQCILAPASKTSLVLEAMGVLISDSSHVRVERTVMLNLLGGIMALRSGRLDFVDNQLRGPTAEISKATSASVGAFGIRLDEDVVGPCVIEHNLLENYQMGISVGEAGDGSLVVHNTILRTGPVANPALGTPSREELIGIVGTPTPAPLVGGISPSGPRRSDGGNLPYLYAIDSAAPGCAISGNFANLTDARHGGIQVTASYTQVEQNEIRSDLDPPGSDEAAAKTLLPMWIYLEQSSDTPRLDHCLIRGNRLSGLLQGIILRDLADAVTLSNYVVENRLEGLLDASYSMTNLVARVRAIMGDHPNLFPFDGSKVPRLVEYLGAGIIADNAEGVILADNHVQSFPVGILLLRSDNARVDGNRVIAGFIGLYAYNSNQGRMTDNIFERGLTGFLGQELTEFEVRGTLVSEFEAVGIGLFNGTSNVLAGSRVDGGEIGVLLVQESETVVTGGEIQRSGLFGMADVGAAEITYAHNRVARCGVRGFVVGILSYQNSRSVTVESCEFIDIGRADRQIPDGPAARLWVTAIGIVGANACRIHSNGIRSLEDLSTSTVHIPIVVFPIRAPSDARVVTRGVEMLDNVVVGPAHPVLILSSALPGTMVFSNNRCQQHEFGPAAGGPASTVAPFLDLLLGNRPRATVMLSAGAQIVMGNRVTTDGELHSFSFSNTGYVTAVGNITSKDWVDVPPTILPAQSQNYNYTTV